MTCLHTVWMVHCNILQFVSHTKAWCSAVTHIVVTLYQAMQAILFILQMNITSFECFALKSKKGGNYSITCTNQSM